MFIAELVKVELVELDPQTRRLLTGRELLVGLIGEHVNEPARPARFKTTKRRLLLRALTAAVEAVATSMYADVTTVSVRRRTHLTVVTSPHAY